jgi:hypothetical protein
MSQKSKPSLKLGQCGACASKVRLPPAESKLPFPSNREMSYLTQTPDVYNSNVPSRTYLKPPPLNYQENPNKPDLEYVDVNLPNHPTREQAYSYDMYKMMR